jgi:hypothetical protein
MTPPNLPDPSITVSVGYVRNLLSVLRIYFAQLGAVRPWNVASLNIDLGTLPTESSLASLRAGDVYRDTAADNALKVKV